MERPTESQGKEEELSREKVLEDAQRCLSVILAEKGEEAKTLGEELEKVAISLGIEIPKTEGERKWKEISLRIIKWQLEIQNEHRIFDSITLRNSLINEHGRMFFTGNRIEIGVIDKEGWLEKDERLTELMDVLVEEAEDFVVSSDTFKALVVVKEGSISIRMDPGKHKEFLAVLLSKKDPRRPRDRGTLPEVIVYEHTPSSYETSQGGKSYRADYILGILEGAKKDDKGKISCEEVVDQRVDMQDRFGEYFRLCHSVKNLDISLKARDVSFAVGMFKSGAVNMERFLPASEMCEKAKTEEDFESATREEVGINSKEKQLLKRYFEEGILPREIIREKLELLRSAKDLNYEIIFSLIKLGDKAREILAISEGSPKVADEFISEFEKVAGKLEEMFYQTTSFLDLRSVESLGYVDIKSFLAGMRSKIIPLANVARFGYGSDSLSRHQDGSVDIGEQGKSFLPEIAREAYNTFALVLDDKGGKIENWKDVKSMEEAVRFLHSLLVESTTAHSFLNNLKDVFRGRGNDAFLPIRVLDLSSSGAEKTETGKMLVQNIIGGRGYQLKRAFGDTDGSWGRGIGFPAAIISDDYFELNMPTNKHYVELCGQTYEGEQGEKEYSISLRYVESQYEGAQQRQDFVLAVLKNHGFEIDVDNERAKIVNASLKTEDKEKWKATLQKVLNLIVAMKDLDMGGIRRDTVDWFEKGVVYFWSDFRLLKKTLEEGSVQVHIEEEKPKK